MMFRIATLLLLSSPLLQYASAIAEPSQEPSQEPSLQATHCCSRSGCTTDCGWSSSLFPSNQCFKCRPRPLPQPISQPIPEPSSAPSLAGKAGKVGKAAKAPKGGARKRLRN